MKLDIVFAGVGGQGIVVASDIFCEAAMMDGWDVAKAEVHGMGERGGSIVAHVRIGDTVQAPLIEKGKADMILGFEMLETARTLSMLDRNGIVLVNTKYISPSTSIKSSNKSLKSEKLLQILKENTNKVFTIDGEKIAIKLGNLRVVNTVLLGAFSTLLENKIKPESLKTAIALRLKGKHVSVNLKAFQFGRDQVVLS
jgi:indolepyruvate ferredoxin oxidoreductase beta subunit